MWLAAVQAAQKYAQVIGNIMSMLAAVQAAQKSCSLSGSKPQSLAAVQAAQKVPQSLII